MWLKEDHVRFFVRPERFTRDRRLSVMVPYFRRVDLNDVFFR